MKISLVIVTALLIAVTPSFSEPSEKEMIDLINRVNVRINGGELNALTELTTLPGDWRHRRCSIFSSTTTMSSAQQR